MTVTSPGKRWELLHSLWIGWILFTFGSLGWAAFIYIGIRAKRRKWILWGFVYAVTFYGGIIMLGLIPSAPIWIISSIHGFRIRKEYLMRLAALQVSIGTDTALRPPVETEYNANARITATSQSAAQSGVTAMPDVPGWPVSPDQVSKPTLPIDVKASDLDLSSASEQELAALPGVGLDMAKRAVNLRESRGEFLSVEDFGEALNLEAHAVEQIRALVSVSPPQQPPRSEEGSRQVVATHDISEIIVLRKRLARAALGLKVIGLISAIWPISTLYVLYFNSGLRVPMMLLGLALGVLIFWYAVRLSRRIKAGDTSAAKIVAVWWMLFVVLEAFSVLSRALSNAISLPAAIIVLAILALPIYFVARGLLALRAYNNRPDGAPRTAELLGLNAWEKTDKKTRHPAFVNKWSLGLYLLLTLVPWPFIIATALLIQNLLRTPSNSDSVELLGYLMGTLIPLTAIFLFGTAWLYRHARRGALLPATELSKRNPRAIILYLRSFLDDQIKMRARATNGRTWLERVVKITFEEVITDHLWRYGPVVAIGKPGDPTPPLGAARDYVSDTNWQQKVEQLMSEASIIVVVVGRTEGLAWELDKIIELGLTRKLVLLLPPIRVGDLPARWDSLCERASEVGLILPRDVDLRRTRAVVLLPDQGAHTIAADEQNDWTYEAVLDAAAELMRHPATTSESTPATARLPTNSST